MCALILHRRLLLGILRFSNLLLVVAAAAVLHQQIFIHRKNVIVVLYILYVSLRGVGTSKRLKVVFYGIQPATCPLIMRSSKGFCISR